MRRRVEGEVLHPTANRYLLCTVILGFHLEDNVFQVAIRLFAREDSFWVVAACHGWSA